MSDHYSTPEAFEAFTVERGYTHSHSEQKELAALLLASEWIDDRYRNLFKGTKTGTRDQVREWPRMGHTDYYGYNIPSDEIPREILHAVHELAYHEITTPGVLHVDYTPSKYEQVSVDGAVAAKFAKFGNVAEIQTQFQKVREIMSGLIHSGDQTSGLTGDVNRV